MDVVTYLWFAALYRRPLAGLTTLVEQGNPTSAARQAVLQRVAAETRPPRLPSVDAYVRAH